MTDQVPQIIFPKDRAARILRTITTNPDTYAMLSIVIEQEINDAQIVVMNGTIEVMARLLEQSSERLDKEVPEMAPCIPAIKSFAISMAKVFRDQQKARRKFFAKKG